MSEEVRTCPKCGQQSVTLVFTWQHTTYGASTGMVTREYRCQSCGAGFKVRPKANNIGVLIAGIILIPTCIGIPFIIVAWMRMQVEKSIPLAIGAPMPLIRYRGGPPFRTCSKCGASSIAFRITRSSTNGIPTGTEFEYRCSKCSTTFVIESPLGQIMSVFGALVLAGISVAFFVASESPWWRFGGGIGMLLLAGFVGGQAVVRFANRFRYPVIAETNQPT